MWLPELSFLNFISMSQAIGQTLSGGA